MNNLNKKLLKNEEEFKEFTTDVRNRQYEVNPIKVDVGDVVYNSNPSIFSPTYTFDWDNEYLEIERIDDIDVVKIKKYNE